MNKKQSIFLSVAAAVTLSGCVGGHPKYWYAPYVDQDAPTFSTKQWDKDAAECSDIAGDKERKRVFSPGYMAQAFALGAIGGIAGGAIGGTASSVTTGALVSSVIGAELTKDQPATTQTRADLQKMGITQPHKLFMAECLAERGYRITKPASHSS